MEKSKIESKQDKETGNYPWQAVMMVGSLALGAIFMILKALEVI